MLVVDCPGKDLGDVKGFVYSRVDSPCVARKCPRSQLSYKQCVNI